MIKLVSQVVLIVCISLIILITKGHAGITYIEPNKPQPGSIVTIHGSGFGEFDPKNSKVIFGGVRAEISYDYTDPDKPKPIWGDMIIKAIIPPEVKESDIEVAVEGSKGTKTKEITIYTDLTDEEFKN